MTERLRAAVHEAGHGLVAVLLDVPFVKLVLREDDGRWGGAIHYLEMPVDVDAASLWADTLVNEQAVVTPAEYAVSAAGIVAECVVCRTFSWRDVVGVSGDLFDMETDLRAAYPDGETRRLAVRAAFQQAEALLTEYRPALEAVATLLETRQRLTYADVAAEVR